MENLFKDFDAGIRFDLKGSFNNRTRLTEGQTIYGGPGRDIMVSLKDNDFRTHMKKITFVESLNHNFPPRHLVIEKDVDLDQFNITNREFGISRFYWPPDAKNIINISTTTNFNR